MFPVSQVFGKNGLAHERLAIIDPDSGSQPLVSPDGNGEAITGSDRLGVC